MKHRKADADSLLYVYVFVCVRVCVRVCVCNVCEARGIHLVIPARVCIQYVYAHYTITMLYACVGTVADLTAFTW